jgi:hypothetical protein
MFVSSNKFSSLIIYDSGEGWYQIDGLILDLL